VPTAGHQEATVWGEREGLDVPPIPAERPLDPSTGQIDTTDPLVNGDEHSLVVEEPDQLNVGFGCATIGALGSRPAIKSTTT
jgi:hypothetical protein